MKLQNSLIVTLPDFAKHFDYVEFWENREQFVRDIHPDKVYYWDEELKKAYATLADWIWKSAGDDTRFLVNAVGIRALELLIGREIDESEINRVAGKADLTAPIIRVQAGTTLSLPGYIQGSVCGEINLCYHKIEVCGHSEKSAVIKIGETFHQELHAGDFVYVTETNGFFIEFLPVYLRNEIYNMNLTAQEGVFAPTLQVRALFSGRQMTYENVVSFALAEDGYIFINPSNKPVIMSNRIAALRFMLEHDGEAFYVKARGSDAVVLYKDGTLRSTKEFDVAGKVVCADG